MPWTLACLWVARCEARNPRPSKTSECGESDSRAEQGMPVSVPIRKTRRLRSHRPDQGPRNESLRPGT
jgi:hypothetical protein